MRFQVAEGNISSNAFLRRVGVHHADAVILGAFDGPADLGPVDADARVRECVCACVSEFAWCVCSIICPRFNNTDHVNAHS